MRTFSPKIKRIFKSYPDFSSDNRSLKTIEGICARIGYIKGTYVVKVYDIRSGELIGGLITFRDKNGDIRSDEGYWIRLAGTADQIMANGVPNVGERLIIMYEGNYPHTGYAYRSQSIGDSQPESSVILDQSLGLLVSGKGGGII